MDFASGYVRKREYTEKILQIGEGNFLRAFADYLVDIMKEKNLFSGSVVLCQPIERGLSDEINAQNGLYTLVLRGIENGEVVEKSRIIESVSRCVNPYKDLNSFLDIAKNPELKIIISNTTEAGIVYSENDKIDNVLNVTYPGKLTKFLYERFLHFKGDDEKGLLILPVELIDENGTNLKKCVLNYIELWSLGDDFKNWVLENSYFSNTLVDRIVTGFPKDDAENIYTKLDYRDALLDTAEPFFFWAVEINEKWKEIFPADKSGLDVVFCDDISSYKTRKVRILNGAHTVSVLGAFLAGYDIVLEMMNDEMFNEFILNTIDEEIIPFINLPEKEKNDFKNAVIERFKNPFIKHKLLDISLNSVSKFKARCLPSLLDNIKNNKFPKKLLFGLACLISFYNGEFEDGKFFGIRNDEKYEIRDDITVLEFVHNAYKKDNTVELILGNKDFWGIDLTEFNGVTEFVSDALKSIETDGVKKAMELL